MDNKQIAFLFDLDGVIIDSETEYTKIWSHINEVYPTGVEDFARKIKGTTLTNILDRYYPDFETRGNVEQLLYREEQAMDYRYCTGAHEFLKELEKAGVPRAIVTSSNDEKMAHLYDQIPTFREDFDRIVDATMVKHSKPNPEGYLLGAEKLGVDIRHCAVVEDSMQGTLAGRNSGAYVIGVAGTLPAEAIAANCDIVVENLMDLDLKKTIEILKSR